MKKNKSFTTYKLFPWTLSHRYKCCADVVFTVISVCKLFLTFLIGQVQLLN